MPIQRKSQLTGSGPVPGSFKARYHGTCRVCSDHIAPGMFVIRYGRGGYAHDDCGEPPVIQGRGVRRTCAACFEELSLSGACACYSDDTN